VLSLAEIEDVEPLRDRSMYEGVSLIVEGKAVDEPSQRRIMFDNVFQQVCTTPSAVVRRPAIDSDVLCDLDLISPRYSAHQSQVAFVLSRSLPYPRSQFRTTLQNDEV
jgi:hypothetical protein